MKNTVVLGLLRGDEGKGKIVDFLSEDHDVVVRFQGGPNAGHTIYKNGKCCVLHQIPSGIFNKKICLIGHGCVIDPVKLLAEIKMLTEFGLSMAYIVNHLKVAMGSHVIYPKHIQEDTNRENAGKGNGSTKCGISPAYRDKYYREGKRMIDLFGSESPDVFQNTCNIFSITKDDYVIIKSLLIDDTCYLNYECTQKRILFEGAQGVFLDIDNPSYPNVSSSHVNLGGVIAGTGINFNLIRRCEVVGIVKSYMSSVGEGDFVTEIKDNIILPNSNSKFEYSAETLREAGHEYGATTGRPRKVGFLDLPMIKYACQNTGVDTLCFTRLDTLYEAFKDKGEFPVCIQYAEVTENGIFPVQNISWYDVKNYKPIYRFFKLWNKTSLDDDNFRNFIDYLTVEFSGFAEVKYISVGKEKEDIIINEQVIEF